MECPDVKPPNTIHVHAVRPERDALVIEFPRVEGYSIARSLGECRIGAVLDPHNPRGSTTDVDFSTSKTNRWRTDPTKCHVNWAICDSDREAAFCRIAEAHPRVLAYVKNQGMGFRVPFGTVSRPREYVPDFMVRVDDGGREPLNLVIEVRWMRGEDAKIKAETIRTSWVPCVNDLKEFGRWDFVELTDVHQMEDDFHRWFAESAASSAVRAAHGLILAGGNSPNLEYIPRRRTEIG